MMSLFKSFHFLHETKARNLSKTEDQERLIKAPGSGIRWWSVGVV